MVADNGSVARASTDRLRLSVCMMSDFAGNARETVRMSESSTSDACVPALLRGSTGCIK